MKKVILLHGFPGNAQDFRALKSNLETEGSFAVSAPDLIGFGAKKKKDLTFEQLRVESQAQEIIQWMKSMQVNQNNKAIIYAHDYGVMVALTLAAQEPGLIDSLFLSSGNFVSDPPLALPMRLLGVPVVGKLIETLLFSRMANRGMARFGSKNTKKIPVVNDELELQAIHTIFATTLKRREELFPLIEERARSLKMPVELIWGEQDPFFPGPFIREKAQTKFPKWQTHFLQGVGHFPQIEDPGFVATLIAQRSSQKLHMPKK